MSPVRRRRPALLTALALVLAIESVTTVAVRAAEIAEARSAEPVAAAVMTPAAGAGAAVRPPVRDARQASDDLSAEALAVGAPTAPDARTRERTVSVVRPAEAAPAPKPRPAMTQVVKPKAVVVTGGASGTAGAAGGGRNPVRAGRNHVWSPALGIDKRVHAFPCSRSRKPGNVVYRWGCGGRNNVYLMGHAANVFGGLNRAYHNGALKRGLKVHYADGNGKVRTYAVQWWKVVRPTPDAAWAWASLSRPSMTLQTCIGRNSEFRLMVRLAQVAG